MLNTDFSAFSLGPLSLHGLCHTITQVLLCKVGMLLPAPFLALLLVRINCSACFSHFFNTSAIMQVLLCDMDMLLPAPFLSLLHTNLDKPSSDEEEGSAGSGVSIS